MLFFSTSRPRQNVFYVREYCIRVLDQQGPLVSISRITLPAASLMSGFNKKFKKGKMLFITHHSVVLYIMHDETKN